MRKFILLPPVFMLSLLIAKAQDNPVNSIGIQSTYSYKGGMTENVNLFDYNLNINLPLLNMKGRAGLGSRRLSFVQLAPIQVLVG